MNRYRVVKSSHFIVTGISHQDADVAERERFSLDEQSTIALINEYKEMGGEAIFVLSTCNRTEIYALTDSVDDIAALLLKHSKATSEDYFQYCYIHRNDQAIEHLFRVAVGMESQILGDFQIIGQLKSAFRLSKSLGASNAFMERLINTVSQCSKQVKNETEFSSGAASTSYAAVNYIKQCIPAYSEKRVLLYGTGKIGQLVCENLIKHIPKHHITVVNRSAEKAIRLVDKYAIGMGSHDQLVQLIGDSDIVIVSTGAPDPTIQADMIFEDREKFFLDLSMPRNVSKEVESIQNVHVADLDTLSQIADETLDRRKEQISLVSSIVERNIGEFREWLQHREFVPTITAIKQKLEDIQQAEILRYKKETGEVNDQQLWQVSSDIIRKFTNQLSRQLRSLPAENIDLVHHLFKIDSKKLP